MSLLLGAANLGSGEKLAWEYPFTYRGRLCSIALQKSGLRLYLSRADEGTAADTVLGAVDAVQRDDGSEVAREIMGKISSATRCLERRVLSVLAEEQTAAGRLTVLNQAGRLRGMYDYFRRLAHDAYAGRGILARDHDEKAADGLFLRLLRRVPEETEGFYATVAMTTAYFSLLEHTLVLILPATDFDPARESVTRFVLSSLQDKLERVFPATDADADAVRMRQRLRDAAERWRNPYGHGGFDKAHGTLAFHVPRVGALPVLLSDYRSHPTFRFIPERQTSFDELCALFDDIDEWLRKGAVWAGMRWAQAGLDVPFNPEFLAEFRQCAAAGPEVFDGFLECQEGVAERVMNMEW